MITASDEAHLCRIEGPELNSTSTNDKEIVDFDLIDNVGKCLVAAQVKSGSPGRTVSAHSSFSVLARLVRSGASQRYELITNMVPDRQCSALMDILRLSASIPDLHEELEKVLSRSEKSLALLRELSPSELQRLERARIVFDPRTDAEIRSDLYQYVRAYRNRHRAGMGERSAGLLVGYLLDEIHARAASDTSGWLLSDFRQESLIEDEALLQALGRQDWGAIYGPVTPVPDVNRPPLLKGIESAFPELPDGRVVRTCVLTGLSGIGKSSLASGYLAKNAHKYDLILWIEAGSQESLVMSFRKVAAHLTRAPDTNSATEDATLVRERVHSLLAALPGRWLMVFDDAKPQEVYEWLPTLGRGDVLVTSTDSAAWSRRYNKVSVGSMSIDEATSLIRNRLGVHAGEDRQIHSLALGLECWPLALELACGYIESCNMSLAGAGEYLDSLKRRALGDSLSVPRGYPRTLVAAIHLSMHHIAELARCEDEGMRHALIQIVGISCYFSPQRIPIHLATVSALVHPDDVEGDSGGVVVDEHGSDLPIREVIRLLTRVSFVRYDAPLERLSERSNVRADDTVTLNSVVQEILRNIFRVNSPLPDLLSQAAFHAERWLREALDHGVGLRAHELSIHAGELAHHARTLNVRSNHTALLLGNLGSFHHSRGNEKLSFELFNLELDWLGKIADANELLCIQTRISLATLLLNNPSLAQRQEDSPLTHLAPVLDYVQLLAQENQSSAAFLAAECAFTLQQAILVGCEVPAISKLADDFVELLNRLPETPASRSITVSFEVGRLIGEQRAGEAVVLAKDELTNWKKAVTAPIVELRRLLVEALVLDQKWDEAAEEFQELAPLFGKHTIHHTSAFLMVHNVGLHCAMHWGIFGAAEALALLAEVMSVVDSEHLKSGIGREAEKRRYILLEALAAYAQSGVEGFEDKFDGIDPQDFDSGEASDVAWVLAASAAVARVQGRTKKIGPNHITDPKKLMRAAADTEARCRLITAAEFDGLLTALGKDGSKFVGPSEAPVAIIEPRYMLGSMRKDTGEKIEMQVFGICAAGFHGAHQQNEIFSFSPGWLLKASGDEVTLVDGQGGLWAVAREKPSRTWISAANASGQVRILYGFGFDLHIERDGAKDFPVTNFAEAAQEGFLCAALVRWGGSQVVPPHAKKNRGRARTPKKGPKRRK
ncbi:NB-ARC domain-containing protein [Streptomyces bobili]|uniref:NB-ARC domain-containing protein n=1 Tax=Streptomyces bobili TaxID=67280 RepID=UPI001302A953|nr:NB-ARC domain-containing protein [Streptomyces bobili]